MVMRILACAVVAISVPTAVFAHTINGKYAALESCTFAFSQLRGESGYTGIYKVGNERVIQYFGSNYCPA
jgi:hypothetical protein